MILPSRRRRALSLATVAALGLTGLVALQSQADVSANALAPVTGGLSQSYNAGSGTAAALQPSTAAPYDGAPLSVRTTYVNRGSAEPTAGIDSKGRIFTVAGAFDSVAQVLPRTFVMRSTDGGATYQNVSPKIPGSDQPNPPLTADPYIHVDRETDRVFNPELVAACLFINMSDDGGQTWTSNPKGCGEPPVDHQTLTTGNPWPAVAPLMQVYPNVVWQCSNRVVDAICQYSLDGGLNWVPTAQPAFTGVDPAAGLGLCGGLHGHIEVALDGTIYVPKGHCGNPWLASSSDGGNTWTRTRVSNTINTLATHNSVAVDDKGNVYYLWQDSTTRLPWMAVSKDKGKTFGPAMMVAPPGVAEVQLPVLIAGDEGRVAINFIGSTNGDRASQTRPWNQYLVVTTNATDSKPLFVSTTANAITDPVLRGQCDTAGGTGRCGGIWDFLDVTVSAQSGYAVASMVDSCTKVTCTRTSGTREAVTTGQGAVIEQVGGPTIRAVPAPAT